MIAVTIVINLFFLVKRKRTTWADQFNSLQESNEGIQMTRMKTGKDDSLPVESDFTRLLFLNLGPSGGEFA